MQTSDYRKQVTERLIGMLESGTAPWQKPWDAGIAAMNRPHNYNGRPYHGVNALLLWCTAIDKGYEDPRWLTFNQVNKLGGHVNKGEKAQVVEYWQWTKDVENPETGQKETVELDHPRVYRAAVFNADQCSGLPPLERPVQQWTPHERADRIVAANGVQVTHNSDQGAFYSPGGDYICLPPKESFATEDAYYSTLLHEVGHSTGHPTRLNRDFGGPFGSEGYAKEELRAELASTFLCGELGIATTGSDEQHAAYVKSWVKALKNDYNEIFRAAADAEKICNYLYDREKEYLKLKEQGLEPAAVTEQPQINAGEQVLMRMTPEEFNEKQNSLPQDLVTVQLAETMPLRGKDVFIINDKIYIGDREYYGNNGVYDNSDNTLEYVTSNPHLLHFVSGREFAYSAESMLKREELDRADFDEYKALKETGVLSKYENIRVGDVSFEGKPFDEVYANLLSDRVASKMAAAPRLAFSNEIPIYDFPFVDAQGEQRLTSRIINEIETWDYSRVHPTNEQLLGWAEDAGIDYRAAVLSKDELLIKAKERLAELDKKLNMPITSRQSEFLDYLGVKHTLHITCNEAETLIIRAQITPEQKDYAQKNGFYNQMFNEKNFSYLNFCNRVNYAKYLAKLEEVKNMAKDEKAALMPASDAQKGFLVSLGAKFEDNITKGEADRMIKERIAKRNEYLEKVNAPATESQKKTLVANNCKYEENITVGEASKIIGKLHATVEQMDYLDKLKISYTAGVTRNEASELIEKKMRQIETRDKMPATNKQLETMKAHGIEHAADITRGEARARIYLSPATEHQIKHLEKNDIEYDKNKICFGRASYLISSFNAQLEKSRSEPATQSQLNLLDKMQIEYKNSITKGEAYQLIQAAKKAENSVTDKQVKKAEELGLELPKDATRAEAAQQIELKVRENKIAEFVAKEASPDAYDKYLELANKQYAKSGDFSKIDDKKIAGEMLKQGFDKQSVIDAITEHSPVGRDYARADKTVEAATKMPSVAKAMANAKGAEKGR